MRLERLRLELGMELAPQKERVIAQLDDLHIRRIGSRPRDLQPSSRQQRLVFAIEFVTVTVTFADLRLSIRLVLPASRDSARTPTPPAASFRPSPRRPSARAACRSRDAASTGRIHWSSPHSAGTHCAQTRCTPSACPGRSRNTAPCAPAHNGSRSASPRCRACRTPPAPESRQTPPVATRSSPSPAPRLRSTSPAASGCARARHEPEPP